MSDLAAIIGALGGLATVCGGGIAFVWNKVEKRAATASAAIDARIAKLEVDQAECERRADRAKSHSAVQLTVIELLWQEVKRLAPGPTNPVLERAEKLLDALKTKGGAE